MKVNVIRSIGMWLLAIILILQGLAFFVAAVHVPAVASAVLALAAGVCIILGI